MKQEASVEDTDQILMLTWARSFWKFPVRVLTSRGVTGLGNGMVWYGVHVKHWLQYKLKVAMVESVGFDDMYPVSCLFRRGQDFQQYLRRGHYSTWREACLNWPD